VFEYRHTHTVCFRRYSLKYRLRSMKDVRSLSSWWNTPNDFNSIPHHVIPQLYSTYSYSSRAVIIYSMKNTFLATWNPETDSAELLVKAWRGLWSKSDVLTVRVALRLTGEHMSWFVTVSYPSSLSRTIDFFNSRLINIRDRQYIGHHIGISRYTVCSLLLLSAW